MSTARKRNPQTPEFLKTIPLYHGSEAGPDIVRRKRIVPGSPDRYASESHRPIPNKVYMTPDLALAMKYASLVPEHYDAPAAGGWIFVIDPRSMSDVIPDEDDVGILIYEMLRREDERARGTQIAPLRMVSLQVGQWLRGHQIVDCMIQSSAETRKIAFDIMGKAMQILDDDDLRRIMYDNSGGRIPAIGREVLQDLNEAEMVALLSCGANVAHDGSVKFKEAWVVKGVISSLRDDGSNFFKMARRVV